MGPTWCHDEDCVASILSLRVLPASCQASRVAGRAERRQQTWKRRPTFSLRDAGWGTKVDGRHTRGRELLLQRALHLLDAIALDRVALPHVLIALEGH